MKPLQRKTPQAKSYCKTSSKTSLTKGSQKPAHLKNVKTTAKTTAAKNKPAATTQKKPAVSSGIQRPLRSLTEKLLSVGTAVGTKVATRGAPARNAPISKSLTALGTNKGASTKSSAKTIAKTTEFKNIELKSLSDTVGDLTISAAFITRCESKLRDTRDQLIARVQSFEGGMNIQVEGDEGDIAGSLYEQHNSMIQRESLVRQLREVEYALSRIHQGTYGICEETEEPIEPERLMALPWTRFSVDGAAIRDQRARRTAVTSLVD